MKRKEKATGTPKKKRPISDERMMINRVNQSIRTSKAECQMSKSKVQLKPKFQKTKR
jgi:hypothetical protein